MLAEPPPPWLEAPSPPWPWLPLELLTVGEPLAVVDDDVVESVEDDVGVPPPLLDEEVVLVSSLQAELAALAASERTDTATRRE